MTRIALEIIEENLKTQLPILDLGNCGLKAIPEEVKKLIHLEEIRLGITYWNKKEVEWKESNNKGPRNAIDSESFLLLKDLPLLKIISASHNQISNINFLQELTEIECLHLFRNNIREIPFLPDKNIKDLNLSNNYIKNIDRLDNIHSLIKLDISNNLIKNVDSISRMKNLEDLDFSHNEVEDVSVLSSLKNLVSLKFEENKISNISSISNNTEIKVLHLSNNPITNLNICSKLTKVEVLHCSNVKTNHFDFIDELPKLEELDISNNVIIGSVFNLKNNTLKNLRARSVNQIDYVLHLRNLENLEQLNISFTDVMSLSFTSHCCYIKHLELHYCKQVIDWFHIFNLKNLESLSLSGNSFSDLSFLKSLGKLKQLDISSSSIQSVSNLSELRELEKLDLSFNKITNIDVIGTLKKIISLRLISNEIDNYNPIRKLKYLEEIHINDSPNFDLTILESFKGLKSLSLNNCNIVDCNFILKHKNINSLDLSNNKIIDISFLKEFANMHSLTLNGNPNIISYEHLKKLENIYSLNLNNCRLSNVDFIRNLKNLSFLYLSHNKISDLSPLIELRGLYSLDLNNNSISDISKLEDLTELRSLDLRKNKIKSIPVRFFQNIKLKWEINESLGFTYNIVNLTGNAINFPPTEVITQGRELIEEYYSSSNLKSLNECKIILVGRGKVGKTSLQKRITGERFDVNEPETHGIRKVKWDRSIKASDKSYIKVNIWDFGGQYIQQTLHQFFYSPNTVYILVLDRRLDEDPEDFLELIRIYGDNSLVIIVYNNSVDTKQKKEIVYDLHPEIDSRLRNKYHNIYNKAFGVCCGIDNDMGVQLLRNCLNDVIPNLDHVKKRYPINWILIKDNLLNLVKGNYIEYSKYIELCSKSGIDADSLQHDLAKMLNNIGTITFFNKQFLGNYYILNPEWITTGVYKIILSPITNTKKGRISIQDVENILSVPSEFKYTINDCSFLLQLMDSFSLSHQFNYNEWLIPSSLETQSHLDLTKFKNEVYKLYYIEYKSSFPASVIHRFIARNVDYSLDKDYWRSGVVVKHPHSLTYIYVEADKKDRQVRLWIKGDRIRDCWEFFRKDFHEFSTKFEYSEYVSLDVENNHKVSYQDLLSCLEAGHLTWFVPGYGDINVMEKLGLFSDIKNTELIKQMAQEQNNSKTITNIQGNFNITGSQVGNIGSGEITNSQFSTILDIDSKVVKDSIKEAKQNEYRDQKVFIWRMKGWVWTIGFLILTMLGLLYIMSLAKWSFDLNSPEWRKITSNGLYILGCVAISTLINGVFVKSLYDRYKSHSNIKAYREMIKLPDDLK